VQNKVLEAVAAGLPVVVTPAVYEGLPDAVRPACRVAANAPMFAEAIADLLAVSAETRRELVSRASVTTLTWDVCLQPLADILRRATEIR
jgi:glycosyltransferase involved in cell wall biosynthesis